MKYKDALKSKWFWLPVAVIIASNAIDLISTYEIVCLKGGFEANEEAISQIYVVGYLPYALAKSVLVFFAVLGLVMVGTYSKWAKAASAGLIIFLAINFLFANVWNLGLIDKAQFVEVLPIVLQDQDVLERLPEIVESFDRERFCKLINFNPQLE